MILKTKMFFQEITKIKVSTRIFLRIVKENIQRIGIILVATMDRDNILRMREVDMINHHQVIKIINSIIMVVLIILIDICNTQIRVIVKLIEEGRIIIIIIMVALCLIN